MQFLVPSNGYELNNCSDIIRNMVYDEGVSSTTRLVMDSSTSMSMSMSTAEAKAIAACNRHSEAERRRRKRINGHLATLRTLLPNTTKTDKASLLAEVVRRVKELKKMAEEMEATKSDQSDEYYMIPSETDELELTYVGEDSSANKIMMKVMICCEDRPELILELTRALRSTDAKVVRTEIGTVGGRIKCVIWVQVLGLTRDQGLQVLRRALYVVVNRTPLILPGNKRPRLSDHF